jgi:hypothetical protein
LPSFVLLVARRGTNVLREAFGVRQPDDTLATLRPIRSSRSPPGAKPLTAAAVMCLVEEGLIGLNRPFIDYVPEWNVPGVRWLEEASVADLLRHILGHRRPRRRRPRQRRSSGGGLSCPRPRPASTRSINRRRSGWPPASRWRAGRAVPCSIRPWAFNLLGPTSCGGWAAGLSGNRARATVRALGR